MKVLVALEHHFVGKADGHIYADGPPRYAFWARYLEVFDDVVVLARVAENNQAHTSEGPADGPGVTFWPLPDYRGPWQYFRTLTALHASAREAVRSCDAYILRVPGLVGRLAWQEIRRLGRPYALEVVGDPWGSLSTGSWRGWFRPVFRRVAAHNLRAMCLGAAAVRYVTQSVLQRRYPAATNAYTASFSDVELQDGFVPLERLNERIARFRSLQAAPPNDQSPWHLGFIGSFAQLYKGADVLLEALARCVREGLAVKASLVGDGRHLGEMEKLSRKLGLDRHVNFLGFLPHGAPVMEFLDSVDLFVMPSRTEGLPRAMLEAMARGCPCIGSEVGGIPELLAPEDLCPPGDDAALAAKIEAVIRDPDRMAAMSQRNAQRVSEFNPRILNSRREEFYRVVRKRTEESLHLRVASR